MSQSDPTGPDDAHHEAELLGSVGWYRHPYEPRRHRHWDGEEWHDEPVPSETVR